MENLIRIDKAEDGRNVVSARELHTFLENGKQFADWIKNRIQQYGFVENEDFVFASPFGEAKRGGHNKVEYAITLDMAKELSMLERNEKGKIARKYFIACEKMLRDVPKPQALDRADAMLKALGIFNASLQAAEQLGLRQLAVVANANRTALECTGVDVMEDTGFNEIIDAPRSPSRMLY